MVMETQPDSCDVAISRGKIEQEVACAEMRRNWADCVLSQHRPSATLPSSSCDARFVQFVSCYHSLLEPQKPKVCCACPETKEARDQCIFNHGESGCQDLIE